MINLRDSSQLFFTQLQNSLCSEVERLDSNVRFVEDRWEHPSGGYGLTRVLQNGNVFEKAGVNFSSVSSVLTERLAARMSVHPQNIFATGNSLVFHPENPMIPTIHMNLRYLELE